MKKMLLTLLGIIHVTGSSAQSMGQSLREIIQIAQSQSPRYKLAQTQRELKNYQYLIYKSDLNPQISVFGNAPVYNKEFYNVRQPDGTIKFQSISQNNSSIGIGVSQQIGFTGGQISMNTDLTRFDDFKLNSTQYNGTPVYLRLNQPLLAFNPLKWRKKIEPLKLQESRLEYFLELENIAQQAVTLYFNILDAQNNEEIAAGNLVNATINYETEKKRIELGTTTEDKLLQLQLQVLNSRQQLQKARYTYGIAQLNLKTFIGNKDTVSIHPVLPDVIQPDVPVDKAIVFARKYRPEFISFERKRLEAMRDVAEARSARQEVNLVASYGLNNAGNDIGSIYRNPNDQQRLSIGFNIPIVDWGRRRTRLQAVTALQKLANFNNDLDESTIIQEVTTIVSSFTLLKDNILLGYQTDSVAIRRFMIANALYQSGKLTVTDLNIAQSEKDDARRNLLAILRQFWESHYLLRKLTLYDFENNRQLVE